RNVVELQVQEDPGAAVPEHADDVRACRREKLQADLVVVGLGQALDEPERIARGREVERDAGSRTGRAGRAEVRAWLMEIQSSRHPVCVLYDPMWGPGKGWRRVRRFSPASSRVRSPARRRAVSRLPACRGASCPSREPG